MEIVRQCLRHGALYKLKATGSYDCFIFVLAMLWLLRFATVLPSSVALGTLVSPSNYTVPGAFPTSVFSKYYNEPTATASQVQPVVSDPVTVCTFIYTAHRWVLILVTEARDLPVQFDRPRYHPSA
jgi:hypothetical protein